MTERIPFEIEAQPDDTTCGPTCLRAVYRHYGDDVSMEALVAEVPTLSTGGTLGVHLANHALARGYRARIVTWNLNVFDPSWFGPGAPPIGERLAAQAASRKDQKTREASLAYLEFLERGGSIALDDLEPALLRGVLRRGVPMITGLSATFLYRAARERPDDMASDDVNGEPVGHFVVLSGYLPERREVLVSDPLDPNPLSESHTYPVPILRALGAIYLGALTHDANLVILEPPRGKANPSC